MSRSDDAAPNALRYAGRPGHVESYFLRANDPQQPRAIWLKATVYAPLVGPPEMESWLIAFDAAQVDPITGRESGALPLPPVESSGASVLIRASRLSFELGPEGRARGGIQTTAGEAQVDLRWQPVASTIGAPLSLLSHRLLREGPFPRSKLLTPYPDLEFSGTIDLGGTRWNLERWPGMQGHNWGREHAFEYAWGQCLFPEGPREPAAMLEGFSARVRVGGATTPRVSCLVVRRGAQTYRFDRLFDLWRQRADLPGDRWVLQMAGPDGEARLDMDARDRPIACLGYRNPSGELSYCFNSKLARVHLQVQPHRGAAFECRSEFGGALEFLRREPDPRFPSVV